MPRQTINKTHKTMDKKHFYETPESELLQVRFERNFLETDPDQEPGNPIDPFGSKRQSVWHYMDD